MSLSKTRLTCLVLAIVVILFGCGGIFVAYSYANSLQTTGVTKQTALNAQYKDNQNYLSGYISGFYEMVGISQATGTQLDTVLTDAAKGRYDKNGFGSGSPLFVAMKEAYPDLSQLANNWGKVQDYISSGRSGYTNTQSKLLDMIRDFDTWRKSGLIQSQIIRMMGYPDDGLQAGIGPDVVYGEAARQRMLNIVLTQDAINAYETGVMAPLQVPGAAPVQTQAK